MPHPHQLKKKYTTIPNWNVMLFFLWFTQWHSQYLNYVALVMAEWI